MSKTILLEHHQIKLKLDRMAWQIAEEFFNSKNIVIVGIENRGSKVAEIISTKLKEISSAQIELTGLSIDKEDPLSSEVGLTTDIKLTGKAVVMVDDVLNSGVTISGALSHILKFKPAAVKVAVLANRDHKAFPIHADFVGVSLATTTKEHIAFIEEKGNMTVYLD